MVYEKWKKEMKKRKLMVWNEIEHTTWSVEGHQLKSSQLS